MKKQVFSCEFLKIFDKVITDDYTVNETIAIYKYYKKLRRKEEEK